MRSLVIALAAVALAGCGTTLSRWKSAEGLPAYAEPRLYVSSAPAPGGDAFTVKSLPERAAAAYIAGLAEKEKTSAALQAALAKPISGGGAGGSADATAVGRVLVVGVQRPSLLPGDRLLTVTVSLKPPTGAYRFTGFQAAATNRSTINIGTVTVTDQVGATFGLAPSPGATAALSPSASVNASRTETGTRAITAATELSVHVAPELVEIYRTGAEGQDLTGDTLLKLSLQLPAQAAKAYAIAAAQLVGDDGAPLGAEKAKITYSFLEMNPPADLYVCARLDYEDRHILEGQDSLDEGRQKVEIRRPAQPAWAPYLLAPAEDLETPLWAIMSDEKSANAGALMFDEGLGPVTLYFESYTGAQTTLAWLKKTKVDKLKTGRLLMGAPQTPFAIADFEAFRVQRLSQLHGEAKAPDCG